MPPVDYEASPRRVRTLLVRAGERAELHLQVRDGSALARLNLALVRV